MAHGAGQKSWFATAKAFGTRTMDGIEILLRVAIFALLWTIPVFVASLLVLLLFVPTPDFSRGERAPEWAAPFLLGSFITAYAALVLGHLYIRVVRKQTLREYIQSKPMLRSAYALAGSAMAALDRGVTAVGTAIGKLLLACVALLAILAVIGVLYWIGSAAFSSAPWWAVVIIVLLVLILLK